MPKNTRGGARQGAGRPKANTKSVTVRMPIESIELAKKTYGSDYLKKIAEIFEKHLHNS